MSEKREPPPLAKAAAKPCWYCGGTDIAKNIEVGQGFEDMLGLKYRSGKMLGLDTIGVEPLKVSLCRDCGTIIRFLVTEVDRDWV